MQLNLHNDFPIDFMLSRKNSMQLKNLIKKFQSFFEDVFQYFLVEFKKKLI